MATIHGDARSRYAHRIPYAFAKQHGVLAIGEEARAVVVLAAARCDGRRRSPSCVACCKRPLVTRAVDAERFAAELARAYNAGGGAARCTRSSRAKATSRG